MTEPFQWIYAFVFSVAIIGCALFYLNSTSGKNSGEVGSLAAKVTSVAFSLIAALTSFVMVAVID